MPKFAYNIYETLKKELEKLPPSKAKKLKPLIEHLFTQATTNKVSGAPNLEVLEFIMSSYPRCFVVNIDIDHFKKINDNYGHLFGDLVLKEIYHYLFNHTRRRKEYIDIIHEHGEEFKLLLYTKAKKDTINVVNRLRIGFKRYMLNKYKTKITFSAGITFYNKSKNIKKTYKEADLALYEAKKLRDRICYYNKNSIICKK